MRVLHAAAVASLALGACATRDIVTTDAEAPSKNRIYVPYALPKGTIKISASRASGKIDVTVTDTANRPDPEHLYVLRYAPSRFSKDTVTIETEKNGLLKSISGQSEDQSGEILKKVFELGKEILSISAARKPIDGTKVPDSYSEFTLSTQIDPHDADEVSALRDALKEQGVLAEFNIKAASDEAPLPGGTDRCEGGVCFRIPTVERFAVKFREAVSVQRVQAILNKLKSGGPGEACMDAEDKAAVAKGELTLKSVRALLNDPRCDDGLYEIADNPDQHRNEYAVVLPDTRKVYSVDVRRFRFVDGKTELAFSEGVLTKAIVTKPSEALGLINMPVDGVKGLLTALAAPLTVKVQGLQGEKSLIDAQSNLAQSQKTLIDAERALKKAREKTDENETD